MTDSSKATFPTHGLCMGSKPQIRTAILSHQGQYYTYLLRRPDGRPFYVGKGKAYRLFQHEIEARAEGGNYKHNIIRAIWQRGESIIYEIDKFFHEEAAAFQRENELIVGIGRAGSGGLLANLTDGGEGASNPSEEVKERHRLTLGGIADDDSDRSIVNKFFLGLGQHASIAVKPIDELKVKAIEPHPSPRSPTKRQAVALAASAVANGIVLVPGCRIPRRMLVNGVPSIMENGVCRDIAASKLALLFPNSRPKDEEFVVDATSLRFIVQQVGEDKDTRRNN
jgi:hypothetical protein